jgi:hypothetical protein
MSETPERTERIRERAYELWERAGKPAGDHEKYWHDAERQIEEEEARTRRVPRG